MEKEKETGLNPKKDKEKQKEFKGKQNDSLLSKAE